MSTLNRLALLERLIPIIRAAGDVVMEVYGTDFHAQSKSDDSPVTEADQRAETLIVPALRQLLPDVPVIAEEAVAAGEIPEVGRRFWLVDPLDGTKEFINRNGEFTVNIALVESGVPIVGVVLAPALGQLYMGALSGGAFIEDAQGRRPLACRQPPSEGVTVVASRSHGDAHALAQFLGERKVVELRNAGSSLKFCLVASGEADLYPRLGRTMEWDIAAGHAVLVAAGGAVRAMDGTPLQYGKPGFDNPHFVAAGPGL